MSPHAEGSASATEADPSEAATPRSLFDVEDTATRRPDGRRTRYQADDAGPLCQILNAACADTGLRMDDLTVLSTPRDPYRLDTPTNHKVGGWLAAQVAEVVGTAQIHCRGLHYKLLSRTKPDSKQYSNDDASWTWLQDRAAKAARWLGYVPFEQIIDERNAEPEVIRYEPPDPWPYLSLGINVDIPPVDAVTPTVGVLDFRGLQPYRLAIVGEKSSLRDLLRPIADDYQADLYLPTGELSDTLIHRMASDAATDVRPLVVAYVADCDPAGYQMAINLSRKLQALRDLKFPHLHYRIVHAALTPAQVHGLGLPSTPLKPKERRADRWRQAFDIEQTEVDAALVLMPGTLERLIRDALDPYFDHTLNNRVNEARSRWTAEAQTVVDNQLDGDALDRLRAEAQQKITELRAEINTLNEQLRLGTDDIMLPAPVIPDARVGDLYGLPYIADSTLSFTELTRRLRQLKQYRPNDGDDA